MNLRLLTYLFLMAITPQSLHAATSIHEGKLYQVEIIIFERAVKAGSNDPEFWTKNLTLTYPDNRKSMVDPAEAEKQRLLKESRQEKSYASLSDDFLQSLAKKEAPKESNRNLQNSSTATSNTGGTKTNTQTKSDLETTQSSGSESTPGQPILLEYLDDDKKILNTMQDALDRSRGLRTVFHQTWVQAMTNSDDAPALMIQGGNQFGDHYELEGTITLSVSRYLHLNTNLWLTHFAPNYGQQSEHWPSLPSQEKEYSWEEANRFNSNTDETTDTFSPSFKLNLGSKQTHGLTIDEPTPNSTPTPNLTPTDHKADPTTDVTYSPSFSTTEPVVTPDENQLASEYIIKEIVTLKQKRRMRSKELHYIDHPRMGLLVKIMPYKAPAKTKVGL